MLGVGKDTQEVEGRIVLKGVKAQILKRQYIVALCNAYARALNFEDVCSALLVQRGGPGEAAGRSRACAGGQRHEH